MHNLEGSENMIKGKDIWFKPSEKLLLLEHWWEKRDNDIVATRKFWGVWEGIIGQNTQIFHFTNFKTCLGLTLERIPFPKWFHIDGSENTKGPIPWKKYLKPIWNGWLWKKNYKQYFGRAEKGFLHVQLYSYEVLLKLIVEGRSHLSKLMTIFPVWWENKIGNTLRVGHSFQEYHSMQSKEKCRAGRQLWIKASENGQIRVYNMSKSDCKSLKLHLGAMQ